MDAFNRLVVMAEEGHIYRQEAIESPRQITKLGLQIEVVNSAHLRCGAVSKGDVVMLDDRRVGVVHAFAIADAQPLSCVIHLHEHLVANRYAMSSSETTVVPTTAILAACPWYQDGNALSVLLPPISATWP